MTHYLSFMSIHLGSITKKKTPPKLPNQPVIPSRQQSNHQQSNRPYYWVPTPHLLLSIYIATSLILTGGTVTRQHHVIPRGVSSAVTAQVIQFFALDFLKPVRQASSLSQRNRHLYHHKPLVPYPVVSHIILPSSPRRMYPPPFVWMEEMSDGDGKSARRQFWHRLRHGSSRTARPTSRLFTHTPSSPPPLVTCILLPTSGVGDEWWWGQGRTTLILA